MNSRRVSCRDEASTLPGSKRSIGNTPKIRRQLVLWQPGVSIGHELLGRGAFLGLPESPIELFAIAEHLGLEIPLSQLFRRVGLAESRRLEQRGTLFINMHPAEIRLAALLASLSELLDQ